MAKFAALWRWLRGEETATRSKIITLEDIPTWNELYEENKEEFVDSLKGMEELPQYAEDSEINRKVSIYSADITSLRVDGIVRSTDTSLTSEAGISGVIYSAAGPKLDEEQLLNLGGCQEGEAKTTLAFYLPAKYIVHTVGTDKEQPEILERCYKSCLEQMRLKEMRSLAFCCISTGHNGYPVDEATQIALKTVRAWFETMKTENKLDEIDRIIFCVFSEEELMLYSIWMQIFFPSPQGSLEQTEQNILRPLLGFIELSTEPDMLTLDDDTSTLRAKMPCGHVIGSESMTDYARDILKKGQFKFICPFPKCNREWEYFLVRHVACLTEEETRECELKLEKNFLEESKGNKMCPGCKTWCMRAPKAGNRVRCPICTSKNPGKKKFNFCWVCLKEWKSFRWSRLCGNLGCDGKDKRALDLVTCSTKRINLCNECPIIRGCPKCGLLIEHQTKCAHMSCPKCRCMFCFVCLKLCENGKWQCHFRSTCKPAPRQA